MSDLILHHYDPSPFAEIARLAFGIKGASWKSVQIPRIMPKPEFTPLTGGYRKAPALQIGADIYCDTWRICQELDTRLEGPDLFPKGGELVCNLFSSWLGAFFRIPATLKLGAFADKLPDDFWADREAIFGMNKEKMLAAEPLMRDQWRAFAHLVNSHLEDGSDFVLGDAPCFADIAAYMPLWFAWGHPGAVETIKSLPALEAWYKRMQGVGHGDRTEMEAADALAIAKAAEPAIEAAGDDSDLSGRKIGDRVTIMTEDRTPNTVTGELLNLTPTTITITQENETVGKTSVSFPRLGYNVIPA